MSNLLKLNLMVLMKLIYYINKSKDAIHLLTL